MTGFIKNLPGKMNKRVQAGLILLTAMVLFCFCGPLFSPYELRETNLLEVKQPPSFSHWLGTDGAGRDVLLRLMYGEESLCWSDSAQWSWKWFWEH